MPVVDRVLTFMSIDDLHAQASKLASLNLVLLLTIAVHQVTTGRWIQALIIVACAVVGLRESYRRPATLVVLFVLLVRHVATFPLISNHSYLELILLMLFVWIDASRSGERELLLQGLRWVTVIVFFYSGVQKAWYGEYFDGRYLAFLAATSERTRMAFELLLPPEELARLVDYGTQVGSGPFRIQSPLFLALSNTAWISEIMLAVLLVVPRARRLAVPFGLLTMVVIEFIARELIFGVTMVALLFLFSRSDVNRRLLPVYVLLLAYLVVTRLGWVPWLYWV